MNVRIPFVVAVLALGTTMALLPVSACCPAPPHNKPVVNADQTVIIIWDSANKTEHFIRKATFNSAADDFGFIVPTPSKPELSESGNEAFPFLAQVTAPEVKYVKRPTNVSCGCAAMKAPMVANGIAVLETKTVAGYDAVILEASSANSLVNWLKEHGYAMSPEIEEWAKPYVEKNWKFPALKVAKEAADKPTPTVATSALRISFQADQPLFQYREPDPKAAAQTLNANHRLLRIFFVGDSRFRGEFAADNPWSGQAAWSDKLDAAQKGRLLELLKLPAETGPQVMWLTEFEDHWPYKLAPGDVYFVKDADQSSKKRSAIVQYTATKFPEDGSFYLVALAVCGPPIIRRVR